MEAAGSGGGSPATLSQLDTGRPVGIRHLNHSLASAWGQGGSVAPLLSLAHPVLRKCVSCCALAPPWVPGGRRAALGGLGSNCIETSPPEGRRQVPSTAGPGGSSGSGRAWPASGPAWAPPVPAWRPSLVSAGDEPLPRPGPPHSALQPSPLVRPPRPPSRSLLPEAGVLADPFPPAPASPLWQSPSTEGDWPGSPRWRRWRRPRGRWPCWALPVRWPWPQAPGCAHLVSGQRWCHGAAGGRGKEMNDLGRPCCGLPRAAGRRGGTVCLLSSSLVLLRPSVPSFGQAGSRQGWSCSL